jgi:CHASE2 domain-containing sensor protein
MPDISEVWRWTQKIAGVFMVVCLCLYVLRCVMAWRFISLDQFDHFMRGLIVYIFS